MPQCTPSKADPHRVPCLVPTNGLEAQTGIPRICAPNQMRSSRLFLNFVGQTSETVHEIRRDDGVHSSSNPAVLQSPPRTCSSARAARSVNLPGERANDSSHRRSSSISSKMRAAIASCSISESLRFGDRTIEQLGHRRISIGFGANTFVGIPDSIVQIKEELGNRPPHFLTDGIKCPNCRDLLFVG